MKSAGTTRWMSPELLDPDRFGSGDGRPTKESDCYALGMVVLEVLSGQAPFPRYSGLIVMRKIIDGERPGRPQGAEGLWFTDDLWETLGRCWSPQPEDRPTVEAVLECLERGSAAWQPLPPGSDDEVQSDSPDSPYSPPVRLSPSASGTPPQPPLQQQQYYDPGVMKNNLPGPASQQSDDPPRPDRTPPGHDSSQQMPKEPDPSYFSVELSENPLGLENMHIAYVFDGYSHTYLVLIATDCHRQIWNFCWV